MIKINRQIFERLKASVDFFNNFTDQELYTFLKFMNPERFKDGETIFEENTYGTKMYIVINGNVAISKHIGRDEGNKVKETILATINPGECFGEMGLIEHRRRSAKSTAQGNALLFSITDEMLMQLSGSRKYFTITIKLYRNFAKMLATRLRESNTKVVYYESKKAQL